jgi:glycosyltransferase involved in cell wall biosynthesis
MKILILIQCTNLGGMEQATLPLIQQLLGMGFEVDVFSLNPVGEMGRLLEKEGVSVHGFEYRGMFGWKSFPAVRSALRASDADSLIMVGHNLMAMLALGNRWHGKRILFLHFHHEGVMPRLLWKLIYLFAGIQFKAIIFPSLFISAEAIHIAPWIRRKTQVLRSPMHLFGITGASDRLQARNRLGLSQNCRYVGNAGWLIKRKRWDLFLDVAARVSSEVPNVQFLIAGEGPEKESLEKQADNLGISERIHWMGWQKNLNDFYQAIEVLLFNSEWDAMGRTPLEAMAHGVPVVASVLNGGLGEIINDPSIGMLLGSHDVSRLASEVIAILSDPDRARSYAISGYKRIEEIGSAKAHANQVLSLLGLPLPVSPVP